MFMCLCQTLNSLVSKANKGGPAKRVGLSRTGEYEDLAGHEEKICFGECPV